MDRFFSLQDFLKGEKHNLSLLPLLIPLLFLLSRSPYSSLIPFVHFLLFAFSLFSPLFPIIPLHFLASFFSFPFPLSLPHLLPALLSLYPPVCCVFPLVFSPTLSSFLFPHLTPLPPPIPPPCTRSLPFFSRGLFFPPSFFILFSFLIFYYFIPFSLLSCSPSSVLILLFPLFHPFFSSPLFTIHSPVFSPFSLPLCFPPIFSRNPAKYGTKGHKVL